MNNIIILCRFAAALDARLRKRVNDCSVVADCETGRDSLRAAALIFDCLGANGNAREIHGGARTFRGVRPAQGGAVAARLRDLAAIRCHDGASLVVQCAERCRIARRTRARLEEHKLLLEFCAASAIQASYRGKEARGVHWDLLLQRTGCAVKLQRYFRSWLILNMGEYYFIYFTSSV